MANNLPEALVSRFAVTVRDVLWFRVRVERFLERAGVPAAIMAEIRREGKAPTVQKCLRVIDLLEQSDVAGLQVIQRLLSEIAEYSDLSHLEPAKQHTARESQAALKQEIRAYADRRRYHEQKEREAYHDRKERSQPKPVDHRRLQGFRDRFDAAFALSDRQTRGNQFEVLLNEIFDYYCPESRGPFRRDGEQVDGHFHYDGHDYLCEIRWRDAQTDAADVSVLRDRAAAGFGGDVRALFVSFNGFTSECLAAMHRRAGQERVVLMDGLDLRAVLNVDIGFDDLLREKLAMAVRHQRAFISARDVVLARIESQRGTA